MRRLQSTKTTSQVVEATDLPDAQISKKEHKTYKKSRQCHTPKEDNDALGTDSIERDIDEMSNKEHRGMIF